MGLMKRYKRVALPVLVAAVLTLQSAPVNAQGTDLGQGIVTRVDVERYADLALDVKDLRNRIEAGSIDDALILYEEGKNSYVRADVKLSLQKLSTDLATSASPQSPAYSVHVYGLADRDVNALNDHKVYADNEVKPLISSGSPLAGDAIVALNMWMYATHLLYHGIHTCQLLTAADNPDIFKLEGGGMDEFIALWIGNDQQIGSSDGHSLYAMTQRAGELFRTTNSTGEAPPNSQLKLLYNEGASALRIAGACAKGNLDSVPALWSVVQRMQSQMYIPLMQLLLDALFTQNAQKTKLYARAIVPQVSQCRPSVYKRLKEALVDGTVNVNRVTDIIADLQLTYDCLGITCADIGPYQIDKIPQCDAIPINLPLAEYTPTSSVHGHSKIDLDILQLEILTSLQSYSFAKMLYMYGRNSAHIPQSSSDPYRTRSLMEMAISSSRKAAGTFYNEFVQYNNDPVYADTLIRATLDRLPTSKWLGASAEQITEVVAKTAAYQVLYMNVLSELAQAIQACHDGDMETGDAGAHQWDEVAAFLIGSLEGRTEGGSSDLEDGQLMWNLANRRAFQFQTLNDEGYSLVNSHLEDLLYAGRAQADALDCQGLQKSADRIQHLMLLPVIQSTIRYAIINQELEASSTNADLAKGETFALSVLPIVKKYDENSAALILENMQVRQGEPLVRDGPQAVANAFYSALATGFGYSCALVGAAPQADACELAGGFAQVKPKFDKGVAAADSAASWPVKTTTFHLASVLSLFLCGALWT